MKLFATKALLLIFSVGIGILTSYFIVSLTCANTSPIYTRQYGPPSELHLCESNTTIPATIVGFMVGISILYIIFKNRLRYSFKLFGLFLIKLILFAAVVWGLTILLYNPISAFICDLTAPKIERATEGLVVPGNWERCYGIRSFVKSLGAASLVSAGITSCIYVLLTKWSQKKKKP